MNDKTLKVPQLPTGKVGAMIYFGENAMSTAPFDSFGEALDWVTAQGLDGADRVVLEIGQ